MPLWIVRIAGSGMPTHWNQPASSSRLTRSVAGGPALTWTSMMIVACGSPSRSASITPVWPKPWSSDCRPVRTRSNCSSFIAPASAADTTNASAAARLSLWT